jgi:hypothetical protein
MNFLYIGPYRQKDYIGQLSLLHLQSIKQHISSSDKLITRPIYLDKAFALESDLSIDTESGCLDKFDIIIQHLPIEFTAINCNTTNIVIPILDPKLCNISFDFQYRILNFCDRILIDDEKHKHLLKSCGISKPIELYEENINEQHSKKFNLDPIHNSYKFGFIGKYQHNKQIITKIIYSFLINYRINNDIRLYLFLIGNEQDKKELEDQILKLKKELIFPEYINPIHGIFGVWEQKEALIALDSVDCFLSLNDDCKYLLYEKFFISNTMDGKKFLINRQNTNLLETPIININNISEYKNILFSVHTKDLINKIQAAPSSQQKHKKNNYHSLGSILCKQAL